MKYSAFENLVQVYLKYKWESLIAFKLFPKYCSAEQGICNTAFVIMQILFSNIIFHKDGKTKLNYKTKNLPRSKLLTPSSANNQFLIVLKNKSLQ